MSRRHEENLLFRQPQKRLKAGAGFSQINKFILNRSGIDLKNYNNIIKRKKLCVLYESHCELNG